MNSILRGSVAELIVAQKLMENNINISFPFSHANQYDMIADNGKSLFKIQVKRAYKIKNKGYEYLGIGCDRQKTSRGVGKINKQQYAINGYDLLIVCDVDKKDFWIIPREDVGGRTQIYISTEKYLKYKNNFSVFVLM